MPPLFVLPSAPAWTCADERAHHAAARESPAVPASARARAAHLAECAACRVAEAHARALLARLRRAGEAGAAGGAPPTLRRRVLALARQLRPSRA